MSKLLVKKRTEGAQYPFNKGNQAKARLKYLLEYVPRYTFLPTSPADKGYYLDTDRWVAFDNTQGECFVEDFATEAEAKAWVEGKEVSNA